MRAGVLFSLRVTLVLFSLLGLVLVHAGTPALVERHQKFLIAANPLKRESTRVRPYAVFDDSFKYLWEHLSDFRCDSLGDIEFVDDGTVDPTRWVYLMTTWIFAPSSRLFNRAEEPSEDGTLVYSIYAGQSCRGEKEQLENLRVAGRFVGKLLQEGLILNQRFHAELYARLSDPPLEADNLPPGQTLAETRLAEFVGGIRDVVTLNALVGVEPADLVKFMHGVAFEELPNWKPQISVESSQENPPTIQFVDMLEQLVSTLDCNLVPELWRLVTGMSRVPLREISKPQGIRVAAFSNLDYGLAGFSVDPSRRLLYLSPLQPSIMLSVLLGPKPFGSVLGYYWLRYGLERITVRSDRLKIEIDIDATSFLDELSAIVDDVAQFVESTITFRGKSLSKDVREHQFFTLAFPRIVGPSGGLFRRVDGPEAPRPIVDLSPRIVADEARHLRHLNAAGLVFGKAIREFSFFPVALSERLYQLICSQTSPALEREDSEEERRLAARYAAFVGGIHKVIPNWLLSSFSSNFLGYMLDPSQWGLLIMKLLIKKVSLSALTMGENDREFFSNGVGKLMDYFSDPAINLSQLSILFWHIFKKPISIESLFARFPESLTFTVSVKSTQGQVLISDGQLAVSGLGDPVPFSDLMNSTLLPSKLIAMATGKGATGQETPPVTAQMGQVFPSVFEVYKKVGEERFIDTQQFRLVVTGTGKKIAATDNLSFQAFLILREICGIVRKPFVYTLRHGRGSYDIDEGEMEDDEAVHLEKLRLIGVIMAKLTILHTRKLLIPLSPRLQQVTYWGREAEGGPLSAREEAFLGGFHAIASPDAIQLLTFREWCSHLDADPKYLSIQGGTVNAHKLAVKLSSILLITDEDGAEGNFATWEEYAQYIDKHTGDFVVCGYGSNEQLTDFIAMAFEEERGLFIVEEGKHVLQGTVVEDEEKHLQALRVAGLLVGRSIQWFIPVGFALHESIYFCLRHHGLYPDGLDPSELMKGRIDAFVGGIFAVVSPIVLGLFTEHEIARLFEWQLPLSVEAIRARHLEPVMGAGSMGEKTLDAFWGAIASFPPAAKSQILRRLCGAMHFTERGIYDTSWRLTLGAIPTGGMPLPPSVNPTTHQISIPIYDTEEPYRTWLFLAIKSNDRFSTQRLLSLAKIDVRGRLGIACARVTLGRKSFILQTQRQNLFSLAHSVYLESPTLFSSAKWSIAFLRGGELEEGQDAGGVFREWIHDIVADILSPQRMLFVTSSAGTGACHIFPEATSQEQIEYRATEYELAGIIFGKAFLEGVPVGIRFAPIIYMLMLHEGESDSFDYLGALEELDPEAYKGLTYLMNHTVDGLNLYFEVCDSEGKSHPLTQDGENVAVTEANKLAYLMLSAEYMLLGKVAESVKAFMRGFHVTTPSSQLQTYMFTVDEIEHVMYGRDSIDIDEWERITVYTVGREPSRELIEWFWAIMREFTLERRQQMLFYTTSLSRLPIGGFEGIPKGQFTIEMASEPDAEALPESLTCFSVLKLHPYESKEKMRDKLEKALDLASKGFGTA